MAFGLAQEQFGPDTPSRPTVAQPGWCQGIDEPLKHPSRVYSIWVNGNENFYFQATPDEMNELIALFSRARLRDHEIWIEPGTGTLQSFNGTGIDFNVSLQILGGIALGANREKDTVETLEPHLTLYVGEGLSLLKQLKLPDNAVVHCEVEGAGIKGKARPVRKAWHGRVQFDDSEPAVDMEHGLVTQVTLWDNNSPDGIPIASIRRDGSFKGVFSDDELADLARGGNWLTVTVGNYLTTPRKENPRFPAGQLSLDKEKAKPLKISRPPFYYGRILFEDGSPPVLNPAPWPGAEIWVDFPYTGQGRLDAEGYFKVFLEPGQLAALKSRKPNHNIYVPSDEPGRSSALDAFPPELLSLDKAKAGVVKIAKPVFAPRYDPARAPSLIGKPLPAIGDFRLEPSPDNLNGQPVLLCFFDLGQRPSRFVIAELVKQFGDLKQRGVSIVAAQASVVEPSALRSFAATNHVAFPVGSIGSDEEKTRFNWGIRSQPWLILTDKDHVIRAEGFALDELDDKLKALAGVTRPETAGVEQGRK